jgi:hypothetical protein
MSNIERPYKFSKLRALDDQTECTNRIISYLESIEADLTEEEIVKIEERVILQFCRGHLDAGTAIGSQTASLCAEPITQSVLKSAHRAGIASGKSPLLVMFSSEPPIDSIKIRPLITPSVALRFLMPIVKDAYSRFIMSIKAYNFGGQSGSLIYLNVYEMVMRGKDISYFEPLKVNIQSYAYSQVNNRTVLRISSSMNPTELRAKVEEHQNSVCGAIEWSNGEFTIAGDFTKVAEYVTQPSLEGLLDVDSMTTLNLKKVSQMFGLLTARVMCEYLLYKEYKYDRLTLSILSGYFCGTGVSRGIDNKAQASMGFFTTLMLAATDSASRAAVEGLVYTNPASEVNACVAMNLESSIAGSTSVKAGGRI